MDNLGQGVGTVAVAFAFVMFQLGLWAIGLFGLYGVFRLVVGAVFGVDLVNPLAD